MREGDLVDGRYRLVAPLGQGGMGQVFRATDQRLRRDVAIKVVDLTQTTDATIAIRFNREAIATARLNHPNIVTIYDAGSDDRTAWLVMELLRGRTLAEILRAQGPLPQQQALRIGRRLAEALVATHSIGVVHRDLKPGNVMVDQTSVKLLDFGIAQVTLDAEAHLTAPALTVGTAAYMSPEQARGDKATAASDVYALGGVLVAMLTGAPPYPGENAIEVANRHLQDPPPDVRARRPDLMPGLDDLIRRMMAKDPAVRPPAALVVQALAQLQNNPDAAPTSVFPAAGPLAAGLAGGAAAGAAGATRVMPSGGPQATNVMPAGSTHVMPRDAMPPQGPPPPSARRSQEFADEGGPADGPDPHRYTKAAAWLGIAVVALLVFAIAWALGSSVFSGGSATPSPSVSRTPRTASPSPTSTPTRTTTRPSTPPRTLPSLPPVDLPTAVPSMGLPSLPSGQEAATRAAIAGVDGALGVAAVGASGDEAVALESLRRSWASTKRDVQSGTMPAAAVDRFRTQVAKQADRGAIQDWQAQTIDAALGALAATL